MVQKYKCGICDSKPDQLSHHKMHIDTQKHKDKRTIFELKLQSMTNEALVEKYKTYNINDIINKIETKKIMKLRIKEKTAMDSKKHKTNELIYKKNDIIIQNTEINESFKYKFLDFLGKMHNLLRGAGVTGDQALDDILNCLFLCYIEDKISEEGNFDLANSTKSCYNGTIQRKVKDYVKYLKVSYLLDHKEELRVKDSTNSICKCAKLLSKHPITKKMFKKDEDFINCPDTVILSKLLENCQEFSKKENIFENVDITGIAYEYMTTKHAGNGGTSKEMGQYFTERPLMDMCFQLIDKTDITDLGINNNSTMGDEFCATFGFPLMARKFIKDQFNIDIQDKNMYGVEYHERLSKFAYMNAMFSMKNFKNIEWGNSFITNVKPHLDISIHNVPFGKSMTPKNIEKTYNGFLAENPGKKYPTFKEYIPFNTKKIDAILASQVVLYKTKKMGLMIIKDGEETSGKSNAKYRKWFSENCIIKKIMKIPSGAFSCTGTKTVCIYFIKKEGKMTENIQFIQLSDAGNKMTEICKVSMDEMSKNNYSWDPNGYIIDEEMEKMMSKSKCEWKKLGEVCDDITSTKTVTGKLLNPGIYKYYSCSREIQTSDKYDYDITCLLHGSRGSTISESVFYNNNNRFSLGNSVFMSKCKHNDNLKYIYYYMKLNHMIAFKNKIKGGGIPMISKSEYYDIEVPIPTIETQKQVVQILDDLAEQKQLLSDRKSGIERQMKYYFETQIKMNDVEIKELRGLVNINQGSSLSKKNMIDGIYKVIGGGKIIGTHNNKNSEGQETIITRVGELSVSYLQEPYFLTENGFSLKSDNDITNKYIYLILKYTNFRNSLRLLYTGGGQQVISKSKVQNFEIPLIYDYLKQTEIVEYLDKLEAKKNSIDKEISDIDNLMKQVLEQSYN